MNPAALNWMEIARICDKVPYEPAETFREAVQSVWFIQLILRIRGATDTPFLWPFRPVRMWPYLEADLAAAFGQQRKRRWSF